MTCRTGYKLSKGLLPACCSSCGIKSQLASGLLYSDNQSRNANNFSKEQKKNMGHIMHARTFIHTTHILFGLVCFTFSISICLMQV